MSLAPLHLRKLILEEVNEFIAAQEKACISHLHRQS
jgi:hypothetical protein